MGGAVRITAALSVLAATAGPAAAETHVFTPNGAQEGFPVPAGVTSIQVTAVGEAGQGLPAAPPFAAGAAGGLPATVSGTLAVTPGQRIYVVVGLGTFNGGGTPRGGAASDVRTVAGTSAASLDSRKIVAGGGGGAGSDAFNVGRAGGDSGIVGAGFPPGSCAGGPGNLASGGAAGAGGPSSGGTGQAGTGGNGGGIGGGGGGGLFGGGGGGTLDVGGFGLGGCGGGGGSSLVPQGGTSSLTAAGTPASVTLTFTPSIPGGTSASGGSGTSPTGTAASSTPTSSLDRTKPSFSSLSVIPTAFQAAGSGAAITAKVGGKVSYRLSEAATTTFTVHRVAAGRKKGRRCAKPTRRNRNAKRCTRYLKVRGSLTQTGKAERNSFTFRGRIGGRKLRPGRYRLTGVAKDAAGNKSTNVTARFRIKK